MCHIHWLLACCLEAYCLEARADSSQAINTRVLMRPSQGQLRATAGQQHGVSEQRLSLLHAELGSALRQLLGGCTPSAHGRGAALRTARLRPLPPALQF